MRTFGWDTETFLIQHGLAAPKFVCASWSDGTREEVTLWEESRARFVKLLERGDHLCGVNIAYDIGVMLAMDPLLLPLVFKAGNAGQFHCCSVREALHDIAIDKLFVDHRTGKKFGKEDLGGRYSMQILMDRHFNVDISPEKHGDVWRYKYAKLDGVPLAQWPQAAIDYPKSDARRHLEIFRAQADRPDRRRFNLHDEAAQVRACIALQFMVMWGFRTDGQYIAHLETQVDAVWNEARTLFTSQGIFRADGTKDTGVLKALVVKAYKGEPPKTKKGGICYDRDTLEESGDPVLVKVATLGKNDKRKSVYIPALKKGVDLPVSPQFNVLVNTGRVSSDWQQMPQKGGIREAVWARPGYVLLSCDLSGAELRTMSQRAILDPDVKFSKMAEFLNAGKDTHIHVAAMFLGLTYVECERRYKAGDPVVTAFRKLAKIFNFGKGGGMGAFAMAYNARTKDGVRFCITSGRAKVCGTQWEEGFVQGKAKRVCALCVQIAKELGERWLDAWPEQCLLVSKARRLCAKGRKVDSITFGSNRVRGNCGYTQWLNNPFQSAVGDGVKAAMWRIDEEAYCDRRSPLWNTRPFLNVHDELLSEVPDDSRRHDASYRVAKILCEEMDKITPDVKNEVEPAIMRRLFKAAAPVHDRSGKLKPWWPKDWNWTPDREQMCADLAA